MHLEWYRYSRNSVKNSLEKYLWSFTIELLFFVYLFIYCFYFVCVAFVVFTLSLLFVYFALTNCRLLIIIVHQVYVRLAFLEKKFQSLNRWMYSCDAWWLNTRNMPSRFALALINFIHKFFENLCVFFFKYISVWNQCLIPCMRFTLYFSILLHSLRTKKHIIILMCSTKCSILFCIYLVFCMWCCDFVSFQNGQCTNTVQLFIQWMG